MGLLPTFAPQQFDLRDLYFNTPMPQGSISAPRPTLGQRLSDFVARKVQPVVGKRMAQKVGGLTDFTPVGNIAAGFDAGHDLGSGNYVSGGLGALLSVLPLPNIEKTAAKGMFGGVADAFKIKPPKRLYRGLTVNADDTVGMGDFFLGKGLYSTPSREHAKRYAMTRGADMQLTPNGAIQELTPDEAWPRNPLVLTGQNDAGAVFRDWMMKQTGLRASEIGQRWPDPGEYVRSLGHDGVVIGDEVVRYR